MSVASDPQIAKWAVQAGWSVDQIPTLIGKAHGESGGDPARLQIGFGSYLNGVKQGGVGLMQVDVFQHPNYNVDWLKDPINNLTASLDIWKHQGWGAWYAPTLRAPSLDTVKSWLTAAGPVAVSAQVAAANAGPPPPLLDFGGLQTGISTAGTSIGSGVQAGTQAVQSAITGIPAQIGHGVANFATASGHNLLTFAGNNSVAIIVAVVIVLVIFLH